MVGALMPEEPTPTESKDTPEKTGTFHRNELGVTGLKQYSGLIYEEFLPQLQGQKAYKVYKEMQDNSPIIGAVLYAVESTLRSVDWTVEPATDESDDIEAAEFLESCMHDMSHTWEDFISEILTMLTFGWSYFEVVYKKREGRTTETGRRRGVPSRFDDGKIGWRKFAPRGQDTLYRWEIDPTGGIHGMHQYPFPTGSGLIYDGNQRNQSVVYLPIERCLLFRTTSRRNNPEGRSMLRTAYRPWYFSKRISEIEAIGLERDLAGMPFASVPIEILSDDRGAAETATFNYIKDVVTKTKRDEQEGIIWPLVFDDDGNKLYEFELLSTGGRRTFDTGAIIQRYTQEQAQTVLADFILLGHEAVGSFALSSDKTELFAVALGSMLDSIEDVINRHAAPRLLALNGLPTDEKQPMMRHGDIESPDLQELITFVSGLSSAGAPLFPDLVLENHLRELANLPPITEEEREKVEQEKMEQEQAMMGMGGMGMGPGQGNEQQSPFQGMGKPGRPQENFGKPQSKNEASTTGAGSGRPAAQATNKPQSNQPKRMAGSAISKALEEVLAKVGEGVE
jgi:hypothetical protein